ncbi:MAG: dihydrolipoamide acetyltransferase family protein [Acidimicrobiia bacterium]
MAREFRLPDIGEGLTEAEIVRWLVAEGEHVDADQPMVEVETDKAVVEIPSPYAGTVISHGGAEGDVIEVGQVLVTIGEGDEPAEVPTAEPETSPGPEITLERETMPEPEAEAEPEPEPIVGTLGEETEVLTPAEEAMSAVPAAVQALPIVRKLARDRGVDLSTVEGSGPGGRITREDVEAAATSAVATETPAPEPLPPSAEKTEPAVAARDEPARDDERRPMSRLRRTIAANMAKSWSEIPHVTTFDDVDATRLLEVRRALGDRHGFKIPVEALVIRAVIPALDAFPEFNATIDHDDLVLHKARDIGIAVDTPDGLLVAVIRDAGRKSVLDLAREVRSLGEGARERRLGPDQLSGQTFTVSNIGAVGGGHGTPIVPVNTTAILSVGMARMRPIVYDDDLAIAAVMPLSLSYDHRVIDGAQGRRFMAMVLENLEEPALFLAS